MRAGFSFRPLECRFTLLGRCRSDFAPRGGYAEEGLDGVLHDRFQVNRYRKLDDRGEAHLIALACSDAPDGRDHWPRRPRFDAS